MKKEYDFSRGKRGAVIVPPKGKTRITIRLDDEILEWFREQVHEAGGGNNLSRDQRLQFNPRTTGKPLRLLSEADWRFWRENGYVIIPNAVHRENLDAVIALHWEFQEMDCDDPATWRREPLLAFTVEPLGLTRIYPAASRR